MSSQLKQMVLDAIELVLDNPVSGDGNQYSDECACDFCIDHRKQTRADLIAVLLKINAKVL